MSPVIEATAGPLPAVAAAPGGGDAPAGWVSLSEAEVRRLVARLTWTRINSVVPGLDNTTISNRWLVENVQQGWSWSTATDCRRRPESTFGSGINWPRG